MDSEEERNSVTERKSKTLPFYNAWPGLPGQPGSPPVALAWRHHTRSLAHRCLVGTRQEETGRRSVRWKAKMPQDISCNSRILSNDLLNFKTDANEILLWGILCFTIFESRLMWNITASIDLWDSLYKCRRIGAAGVKSCPTKFSDPSPPTQGLDGTRVIPPVSRVTRTRCLAGRWMAFFPSDAHR